MFKLNQWEYCLGLETDRRGAAGLSQWTPVQAGAFALAFIIFSFFDELTRLIIT